MCLKKINGRPKAPLSMPSSYYNVGGDIVVVVLVLVLVLVLILVLVLVLVLVVADIVP